MTERRRIVVKASGDVRFIYNDELRAFMGLGVSTVKRASHVEPNEEGNWIADMSPVGGPELGPFIERRTALAAEVRWLEANGLPEVTS